MMRLACEMQAARLMVLSHPPLVSLNLPCVRPTMNSSVAPNSVSAEMPALMGPRYPNYLIVHAPLNLLAVFQWPLPQPPSCLHYSTTIIYAIALIILAVHLVPYVHPWALARHVHRRLVGPGRCYGSQVRCRP